MTEADYISEIERRWPSRCPGEPTRETIHLTKKAVEIFPKSAKLWVMRGNLLQLIDFECDIPLGESEYCYRQAIAADHFFAEAYEEMGYFLDVIMGKPRKAKRFFDKARRLKRSRQKYNRVIAA
ncbi:hypothetical protein V8J88_21100 [Massilia sp. W12]|uniref:hypothetical protein n=1 Tax=Massilia sp. W12 TaxID=3126507 RepID=UPI0030CB649C